VRLRQERAGALKCEQHGSRSDQEWLSIAWEQVNDDLSAVEDRERKHLTVHAELGDAVLSCLGAGDDDVNIMHARILTRVVGRIKGIRMSLTAPAVPRNSSDDLGDAGDAHPLPHAAAACLNAGVSVLMPRGGPKS
jgi:hypothetical protein